MKNSKTTEFNEHQIIPNPCRMTWEDLDLRSEGLSHCSDCDCEVRDLTGMSSEDIYALKDQLGGKLCGMIYKKDNFVVTETLADHSNNTAGDQANKLKMAVPKIIGGGLAALSIASCASTKVVEPEVDRTTANAFPKDVVKDKDVKKDTEPRRVLPEQCLVGIIAAPPKN